MFQRGILKSVVVVSFSMLALALMAGQGYTKDKTLEVLPLYFRTLSVHGF